MGEVVLPPEEVDRLTWSGPVVVTDGSRWDVPPLGRATLSFGDDGSLLADVEWSPGYEFEPKKSTWSIGWLRQKDGDNRVVELAVVRG